MKKFLAILVLGLGLVFSTPSYAAKSLCIYKEYKYIYFTIQSSKKPCKGYAIEKKMNKKLYNRIKWRATSKSSGNNYGEPYSINREENHFNLSIVNTFWFISINHDDPKWEDFVEKTLGFTFKRENYFRKNNSDELVSMKSDGKGNIIIGEQVITTEATLDQLLKAAQNLREEKITREEFNKIKDKIFETL